MVLDAGVGRLHGNEVEDEAQVIGLALFRRRGEEGRGSARNQLESWNISNDGWCRR